MLKRSECNKNAAFLLLGKHHYDGCVVAFYYSVLQRMMYALNENKKRPLHYENQNPLDENIHQKILIEITNRIGNQKEGESFKQKFEELLEYRKKADYQWDSITQEECVNCRALYEGMMSKLNRFFPL